MKHLLPCVLTLFLIFSCDSGSDGPGLPTAPPATDTGATNDTPFATPDAGQPPAQVNQLSFTTPTGVAGEACTTSCSMLATPGVPADLNVFFRQANGAAIPNAAIQFVTSAPNTTAILSSTQALTNVSGLAGVKLNSFPTSTGNMQVVASVPSDPTVAPITFQITFVTVEQSPLTVQFKYMGSQGAAQFEGHFFLQNNGLPKCSDVHPDSASIYQTAIPIIQVGQNQSLKPSLPGLKEAPNQTQMWTVQIAGPAGSANKTAVGCMDNVEVKYNETRTIEITVTDIGMKYKGVYDVTTWMNLKDGLSGDAGGILGTVIDIFVNPGDAIKDNICPSLSSVLKQACNLAAPLAGAWIMEQLAQTPGFDLAYILQNIKFKSRMTLIGEPSVPSNTGLGRAWPDPQPFAVSNCNECTGGSPCKMGDDNKWYCHPAANEQWEYASFKWSYDNPGNCPPEDEEACLLTVKLEDVYGQKLEAYIQPWIDTSSRISIPVHEVPGFSYGTLLSFLIEKKIIPLIFGDGTSSYQTLIESALGGKGCQGSSGDSLQNCCDKFAQSDPVGFGITITKAACMALVPAAVDWIQGQFAKLGGSLSIGTEAVDPKNPTESNGPCQAFDPTKDLATDSFGTNLKRCNWDATWTVSNGDFKPTATWYGVNK